MNLHPTCHNDQCVSRLPRRPLAPLTAAGLLAVLLLSAPAAMADELVIGGITRDEVRITGVRGEMILYETAGGSRRQAPVNTVERISLRRHPAVAEAEDLSGEGAYAEAAERYAQALEEMDGHVLEVLIHAKLVASLDAAGEAEQAVRQYVALLGEDQGDLAVSAAPSRLPRDAETRAELIGLVQRGIARADGAVARRPLRDLLERLEADPEDEAEMAEGENAGRGGSSLVGPRQRRSGSSDRIDGLIEDRQWDAALRAVDEAMERNRGTLSRRLHQRGLILAGLGRERDAALSFMRVVIHFNTPRNPYYVPSLIEGGKLFVEMDEPGHARQLWDEARLVAEGAEDDALLEQIDQLLESLP